MMKELTPGTSISWLCGLFGLSRQGWYKMQSRKESKRMEEELILELVGKVRKRLPRVGTRKLYHLLKDDFRAHHLNIGRDGLFELLSRHEQLVRPKRRYARTTNSHHWLRVWPNLIMGFEPTAPQQLWVCDVTYIRTEAGFCYLSLVTDGYSRKIVGAHLSRRLDAGGCIAGLEMALESREPEVGALIHHSDRGVQYCSTSYVETLQRHHIRISMAERGNPYENAMAERVNGILKGEFGMDQTFTGYNSAAGWMENAVYQYNSFPPHSSCDFLTPDQAHQCEGPLTKRWKRSQKHRERETKEPHLGALAAPQTPRQE